MVLGIKLNEIKHFESFWKFVGQKSQLDVRPQTLQLGEHGLQNMAYHDWKKCQPQTQHLNFLNPVHECNPDLPKGDQMTIYKYSSTRKSYANFFSVWKTELN